MRSADDKEARFREEARRYEVSTAPLSDGDSLPRYGIQWHGPQDPIAASLDDGYWTPWHLAQAERDRLLRERAKLEAALKAIAAPTYGTELSSTDADRADIYWGHITRLQGIAREAVQ